MSILELQDVTVNLGGRCILDKISIKVDSEDFIGIIGPNGGGKTTLLRVMLGLQPVDRGIVLFHNLPLDRRRTSKMGYVPQVAHFSEGFPVAALEVVLMGRLGRRSLFGNFSRHDRALALEALDRVGLATYRNERIGILSGGELQRLLIARALVSKPDILLLDESTSNVDQAFQQQFHSMLKELHEQMPIILVSHDISAVSILVDKVGCLNRQLFLHDSGELSGELLSHLYQCPVDLIAHGVPHRVFGHHASSQEDQRR